MLGHLHFFGRSDGEGIITGASGLVGGELLRLLRLDARVTSIIAPTRNPLPAMNKLINPHGENIGQLLKMLHEPVDLVFCALGTTRKQAGSQAAFRQVDYRLVLLSGENRPASGRAAFPLGERIRGQSRFVAVL